MDICGANMKLDSGLSVIIDFAMGRHTFGQIANTAKYVINAFYRSPHVYWDPISLAIFPTYRCTMHCDMCLTHSTKFSNTYGQKPCKDMDIIFFKNILERYKNSLSIFILGNGEALLNKDFFKMVEHASRKKMIISAGSNGLIVGDYIKELCKSSISTFDISVNGHNSFEFNRMTGMDPDLFHVIVENSSKLIHQRNLINNKKLKIFASFILDKFNYKNILEMIYLADGIGFDKIIFFQFLATPVNGFSAEERCLFNDDLEVIEAFNQVKSLPKKLKTKVQLPPLLERGAENRNCDVWYRVLSIDGDGNVGGCCCQILDLSISGKFSDIDVWNSSYFKDMRKRFSNSSELPLLGPCKYCYNNLKP